MGILNTKYFGKIIFHGNVLGNQTIRVNQIVDVFDGLCRLVEILVVELVYL